MVQVLGALTYTQAVDQLIDGTELIGSGRGAGGTTIMRSGARALDIGETAKVSNLRAEANMNVVLAQVGARITSVDVTTAGNSTTGIQVVPASPSADSLIEDVSVGTIANGNLGLSLVNGGGFRTIVRGTSVSTSEGVGVTGSGPAEAPSVIQRSTIRSTSGLRVITGHLALSGSVVEIPTATAGAFGAQVGSNSATQAALDLLNVTVDGPGALGTGVATAGSGPGGGTVTLRGSIVQNFASDSFVDSTGNSIFDGGTSDFTPPQSTSGYTDSGGNVDVDPKYVDRGTGDYRLRFDSPVLDLAGTASPSGDESPTDRGGNMRLSDGDGDGQAQRDMGAFEYRRPAATFTASPNPALEGQAVAFEGSASTYPDGAIASYEWDLDGDGSFETNTGTSPATGRTYPSSGQFAVKLRVNGTDGASDIATVTLGVADPLGVTDLLAPVIGSAVVKNAIFRVGPGPTRLVQLSGRRRRAKVGTVFRYTLSEAARVTIAIQQRKPGRRAGRRCRKQTRRNRSRRRCRLWPTRGTLRRTGLAGRNRVPFSGRLGRKALKPGRYRAVLIATDAAGNRSAPKRLTFKVVRR